MQSLRRIRHGYVLVKQSISVVREHPQLGLFPVVSGVVSVVFFVLILTPIAGLLALNAGDTVTFVAGAGALIGLYLGTSYISAFFTAGLIHQTHAVLVGKSPSLRAGVQGAWEVKRPLFIWAVISATVGVILDAIAESESVVAKLLTGVFGIAWTLMTFFVLPVIVFEKSSIRGMFTRSTETFKQTFGETPIGLISVNVVAIVAALPLLALGTYLLFVADMMIAGAPLFMGGILLSQLLTYTLRGILKTSLYFYAEKGKCPKEFDSVFKQLDKTAGTSISTGPTTGGFR